MKDLIEFKNNRIESLQKEVAKLNELNYQYATWLLELCDEDCPKSYRDVIKQEVIDNY